VALTAILLALAAVIALASRSSDGFVEEAPRLVMEEKPTLRAKPHGAAHQLHAMPKPAKGKFTKQALAEAFSSYNKKTGYLINR
jgi:hypothetical protein